MLFIDILQGCNVFHATCNEYLNNNSLLDLDALKSHCSGSVFYDMRFIVSNTI